VLAPVLGEGQLTIIDAGRPPASQSRAPRPGPSVTLRIHTWWTGIRLALRPRLALGEAYMDGTLTVEEGSDNLPPSRPDRPQHRRARGDGRWYACPLSCSGWLRVLEQYNPIGRAQRNVAPSLRSQGPALRFSSSTRDRQYSCAYFKTGEEPLEQAQLDKKRHIAAKLLLQPGQHVLDNRLGLGRPWASFSASSSAST